MISAAAIEGVETILSATSAASDSSFSCPTPHKTGIFEFAISSEVFDSYARQYVIGRKSWIDVLNAVRETMTARFTLADARSQAFAAGLRLQVQTAPSEMKNQDQR